MTKSEIFILSEEHSERGSEKLSAYSTEAELIDAVRDLEGVYAMAPAELDEAIAKARKENGQYGVNPSFHPGWGGSFIFILSCPTPTTTED